MNTLLQPGQHPDPHPGPDLLSAFADHALPPHEQQQTLAHLATCADCRQLVYLAQQANPIELPQPQPIPARRPWFASWKLALPVAAAFAALLLFIFHPYRIEDRFPNKTVAVEQAPPPIPLAPPATIESEIAPPKPQPPTHTIAQAEAQPQALAFSGARAQSPMQALATPMAKSAAPPAVSSDALSDQAALAPPAPALPSGFGGGLGLARTATTGTAIHGTITDPTGAAIPRARITATNTLTGVSLTRETSTSGGFFLSPLPSGTYNLEASAPGFEHFLQKDVQVAPPTQLALNLKLAIGSASQTVTVTNAPPALDTTASATLGGTIENELYTELPLSPANAPPKKPASQYLQPGVAQSHPPAAPAAPAPPPAPPTAATAAAGGGAGARQGIYGGTGQSNLNQNYVEAVPNAAPSDESASSASLSVRAVTAAAAPIAAAKKLPTLPSHLPALSTIANTHHALALDSAGTLFRSEDAGVTWLPVATQWKGRATRITLTPAATLSTLSQAKATANQRSIPPTFQLTTDTGALYTSPDGQTWHPK